MPQTKKRKTAKKTAKSAPARRAVKEPHMAPRRERCGEELAAQLVPPILVLAALFIVVCFISAEATGFFGSWLSSVLYGLFSNAAFTIPVYIVIIAAFWKRDYEAYNLKNKIIFAGVCLLCVSALMQLGNGPDTFSVKELWEAGKLREGGGVIGGLLGQVLLKSIGRVGMLLVTIALLAIFGLFLFGLTPHAVRIWAAFLLHEHRERLKTSREELERRRVYLDKPQLEPDGAAIVPAPEAQPRRGRMSAESGAGKGKRVYIYEGDDGGDGKIKPVDYDGTAEPAKQITINDKEASADAVDRSRCCRLRLRPLP